MSFDPDEDGFVFEEPQALLLHHNTNMLQFVRKNLGFSAPHFKAKHFDQGIEKL